MRAVRQFVRTYRVALIAVALAAVHSLLFWSLGPRVPLGLFIAAVMVSAWQGGLRSAAVATLLSVAFLAAIARYQAPGPEEDLVLRLGLFVLVGVIAGYLSQQCQQAIRAVDHVHEILGGSGLALISTDAEGRITSLNPLARALTGAGPDGATGQPWGQAVRLVHGPARQPLAAPLPGTTQELAEGTLLLGPNGAETAVEGSINPVRDADGRPAGTMIVLRESGSRSQAVQELRQRADRFRALAGHAPAGLMVLDAEGRCVYCNPAAQAACGCSADECLGEGWSRHVSAQDRDRLLGDWLKAVVTRQPFADEFRVQTAAGAAWLGVRSAPMLGDGGEVLGHVAALEDVTARRRAEAAHADAKRESEEQLQEWSAAEAKAKDALQAARQEHERRWQEQAAARQSAEEALRKALAQLEERGVGQKRAEEALQAARAEHAERHRQAADALAQAQAEAREHSDGRQRAEEALAAARQEHAATRQQAEEQLRQLRESHPAADDTSARRVADAWREEVEAVVAMHLAARAQLVAELTGHRDALEATRSAHERLQSQVAEKDGSEAALRQELARLGEEAAATRQAHDRLQALLAEKDQAEAALRQQLARLEGEPAARRQAEEAHERLRSLVAEKEQDAAARQPAADERRRRQEFLEGVLDGTPVGVFAHDGDGRCVVWNAALERILGRPRAAALGRTAAELLPPTRPAAAAGDGASSGEWPAAVIGRADALETAEAPVRDASGAVIGGLVLVRVLPARPAAGNEPSANGTPYRGAGSRLGDVEWLAFN